MQEPATSSASVPDPHEAEARAWLENVYQGDKVRQLSVRSVVTGMIIGGVMSVSNLYVGLKIGWSLGVTVSSCIIAYAVFRALEQIVPEWRDDPFTILENYTMSSAASAASYLSSAGLVSAIPALFMINKELNIPAWHLMIWLGAVSTLGVFMAVPMKRQLINIEKLPFPSGIATAETLKTMHASGAESVKKAYALFIAGAVGAVIGLWKHLASLVDWAYKGGKAEVGSLAEKIASWSLPDTFPLFPGKLAESWKTNNSMAFEGSLIMVSAGALMGIRNGVSVLFGSLIFYGLIGTELVERKITAGGFGSSGITRWVLWPAVGIMVSSGLLAFAFRWRTILRAFSGLGQLFGGGVKKADPLDAIEVPNSWFAVGMLVSGTACVVAGYFIFGIALWMGALAVVLSFFLSMVAARATGETDVTPIGAMGKITQLVYGAIDPARSSTTNLMTAGITAGAASHAADLLTDLKSGYLLGGNPRKQTISQLFGVLAGTLICVPAYMILVNPKDLGTDKWPAPAAQVWKSVAELLSQGPGNLPPYALTAMIIGIVVGIVISVFEEFAPKRWLRFVPSATGLGLGGIINPSNSIAMFIGAAIVWWLARSAPKINDSYTIPVASGLIAGESLMAASVSLLIAGSGVLATMLFNK